MKHIIFILILTVNLAAQISVTPESVNVNSQDASAIPLTFGPIPADYRPVGAVWCGELMGQTCRTDTITARCPTAIINHSVELWQTAEVISSM